MCLVAIDKGRDVEDFVEIGGWGDLIRCCGGGEEDELRVPIGPVLAEVEDGDGEEDESGGSEDDGGSEKIGIGGGFHASIPVSTNGGFESKIKIVISSESGVERRRRRRSLRARARV